MSEIHPVRYAKAMSAQLRCLEALSRAMTMPSDCSLILPRHEMAGLSQREFRWLQKRADDLEALMADWYADGQRVGHVSDASIHDSVLSEMIYLDDVPPGVCFFTFAKSADLHLQGNPGVRIDGFYTREVAQEGTIGVEVTVVCDEPAWADMSHLSYGDALIIGSRVAVGHIPFWMPLPPVLAGKMFSGDPEVLSAPNFPRAIGLIGDEIEKFGRPKPRYSVPAHLAKS